MVFFILALLCVSAFADQAATKIDDPVAKSLVEKFMQRSESKAVREAEKEWEMSKKDTENLIHDVHDEVGKLHSDLDHARRLQEHDVSLVEEAREKQAKRLEAAEKKLELLAHEKIDFPKMPSSFVQENSEQIFAPLEKASSAAKAFAANIKKHAQDILALKGKSPAELLKALKTMISPSASLLETGVNGHPAAFSELEHTVDKSNANAGAALAKAQEALARLNTDLSEQRRELQEQQKGFLAQKKSVESAPVQIAPFTIGEAASPSSFMEQSVKRVPRKESLSQIRSSNAKQADPLSPESLRNFHDKFEDMLQKTRENGLVHESLIQTKEKEPDFNIASFSQNDEEIREGQRQVKKLQDQFKASMDQLQQDNASLLSEARANLQKNHEMQADLETEAANRQSESSSLMEVGRGSSFNLEKEQSHIRDLMGRWKRQAALIAEGGDKTPETNPALDELKEKEQQTEALLTEDQSKLKSDLEKLQQDVATEEAKAKEHRDSMNAVSLSDH